MKGLNSKSLIFLVVLVFIIALVTINLDMFTGRATKLEVTKLYVSDNPNVKSMTSLTVYSGDTVYFTCDPGTSGSSGTLTLYDMERSRPTRVKSIDLKNCGYALCRYGRVGYADWTIPYNYKGEYCGVVKDIATSKEIKACFTVK